jgi:UDP-N-acetylglucosamine--N-acetylmuramyl-(pentapeptide) pyrophosphoryl-undecaprenol N-acetylglucosamine transferase
VIERVVLQRTIIENASMMEIPTVIQEQNLSGITNKLLSKKSRCKAYENLERFFPKDKMVLTGNRCQDLIDIDSKRAAAIEYFNLDAAKKHYWFLEV